MRCKLRIGSDAYCRWARKNLLEMIDNLNNRIVSQKEKINVFVQGLPIGTFQHKGAILDKVNGVHTADISDSDLARA